MEALSVPETHQQWKHSPNYPMTPAVLDAASIALNQGGTADPLGSIGQAPSLEGACDSYTYGQEMLPVV